MSSFLNNLKDKLTALEQEMQILPEELDVLVKRLDRRKLRNLFFRLNQDLNNLLDARYNSWILGLPLGIQLTYPYIRQITNEDLQRWREAYKSEVRVIIGEERVELKAPTEVAGKYNTVASRIIPHDQQQGYIVLSWEQYQKLLDEISKLMDNSEESGRIAESGGTVVGIPLSNTDSNNVTKLRG